MNNQLNEQWFVQSSQGELGPYSLVQLQQLAGRGAIHRGSLLRNARSSAWIRAEQMPSIFSSTPIVATSSQQPVQHQTAKVGQPPALPKFARTTRLPSNRIGQPQTMMIAAIMAGVVFLVFALRIATAPSSPSNNYISTEDLVSKIKESVAIVRTPESFGSGFMVEQGVVATNYHVIAGSDADSIDIYFVDGPAGEKGWFPARLIAAAPDRDLALLQVNSKAAPLTFDANPRFRRGQDVVIIGSPGVFNGQDLLGNAVEKGLLSSEVLLGGLNHYQISLAVNSGNSGGPVIGMDGNVVGVVVSKSKDEEAIGFCIPASELVSMLHAQRSKGFAPTQVVKSEHNARRVIGTTLQQVRILTAIASERSENDYSQASGIPAQLFVQDINDKFPETSTDHSLELSQISRDTNLSVRQRADIDALAQRYNSFQKLLTNPPRNLQQFVSSLESLEQQYIAQLQVLNRSLEMGMPEL